MNHTPQHPVHAGFTRSFVLLMMGLTCAGTVLVMKLRDRPSPERVAAALVDTLSPQQQLGPATQAAGHIPTQAEIVEIAKKALGPQLAREVSRQGGHYVSAVSASGSVPASTLPPQSVPTLPDLPGQTGWSGTAVQDRGGLPPLTQAHFAFDAVSGLRVAWQNREERFDVFTGSWRNDKDGLHGAIRIKRTVDGREEEIRIDKSDAFYPASEVARIAPNPKYGFAAGLGRDALGKVRPNVLGEYYLSRNTTIFGGYINGGPVLMGKYIFGSR